MKSNLLSQNDVSNSDSFKKDIEYLSELEEGQIALLAEYLPGIYLTPTDTEEKSLKLKLSSKVDIPLSVLNHSIDISKFFLKCFLNEEYYKNDSPSDIASDICDLNIIPHSNEEKISSILSLIKKIAVTIENNVNQKKYISAVIPLLKSITFVVDQRCIFDEDFDHHKESYAPSCTGVVPIALFTFKNGSDESINFAADRRTLQLIQKNIDAALSQIEATEEYLNLK